MPHPKTLDSKKSVLVIVDVQEAFRSVIYDMPLIATSISTAVRGMQILGVPVVVTEQYPKGLGPTVEEISAVLTEEMPVVEKTSFGAYGEPRFVSALEETGAKQILLCGIETHICVNQTAHGLLAAGYDVHLLTDCVGSRFAKDKEAGLKKMAASGVTASSVEMAFFEMLGDAGNAKFKEIQALIK
jgi:nicotinamidase-related amidase